jgi:hypothetical protein
LGSTKSRARNLLPLLSVIMLSLLALALFTEIPAHAQTIVQIATGYNTASAGVSAVVYVQFTSAVTVGDIIAIAWQWSDPLGNEIPNNPTDSQGNSYTTTCNHVQVNNETACISYGVATATGGDIITASFLCHNNGGTCTLGMEAYDLQNFYIAGLQIATGSCDGCGTTNPSTSTSLSVGTHDFVLASIYEPKGITPSSGFTICTAVLLGVTCATGVFTYPTNSEYGLNSGVPNPTNFPATGSNHGWSEVGLVLPGFGSVTSQTTTITSLTSTTTTTTTTATITGTSTTSGGGTTTITTTITSTLHSTSVSTTRTTSSLTTTGPTTATTTGTASTSTCTTFTIASATTTIVVPPSAFSLNYWWFPFFWLGLYTAFYLGIGAYGGVSSKGLTFLLFTGLTLGSIIGLILGIVDFLLVIVFFLVEVIYSIRMRRS